MELDTGESCDKCGNLVYAELDQAEVEKHEAGPLVCPYCGSLVLPCNCCVDNVQQHFDPSICYPEGRCPYLKPGIKLTQGKK